MINNKTIAVVIPAYNEEKQIGRVIETMPEFVDRIIVINDNSTDNTKDVIRNIMSDDKYNSTDLEITSEKIEKNFYNEADIILQEKNREEIKYFVKSEIINPNSEKNRIILINNIKNRGVGACIARGYKWAKDNIIDCTAVMAGDGQMDPAELESICKPVCEENIDYIKGNRLIHRSSWLVIPKARFFGNSVLSILTKLASGYWRISDTQCGYTAISKNAINSLDLHKIYKSYGMPNDLLVKLNIAYCTIREVDIKPVYRVGEKSKMNILKVIPRIGFLLFRSFFKRIWIKYFFRDFHPLFILYHLGFLFSLLNFRYFYFGLESFFTPGKALTNEYLLIFIFLTFSGFQSILFAMWMDIQDNERLYK